MAQVPYSESRMVAVNDRGDRLGEDHPRAKLTNHDIDLMFELRFPTDGASPMSYGQIAEKFEVSKGYVSDILSDRRRRRACTPSAYRRVRLAIVAPGCSLTIARGA